jgi:hypothetical protein
VADKASHLQNEGICELVAFQLYKSYLQEKDKSVTYEDVDCLVNSSPEYREFRSMMENDFLLMYSTLSVRAVRKYLQKCLRARRVVTSSDKGRCYKCRRSGHVAWKCRTRCYRCKKVGHIVRDCRFR